MQDEPLISALGPLEATLATQVLRLLRKQAQRSHLPAPQLPLVAVETLIDALAEPYPASEQAEHVQQVLERALDAGVSALSMRKVVGPVVLVLGPTGDREQHEQIGAILRELCREPRAPNILVLAGREAGAELLEQLRNELAPTIEAADRPSGPIARTADHNLDAKFTWVLFDEELTRLTTSTGSVPVFPTAAEIASAQVVTPAVTVVPSSPRNPAPIARALPAPELPLRTDEFPGYVATAGPFIESRGERWPIQAPKPDGRKLELLRFASGYSSRPSQKARFLAFAKVAEGLESDSFAATVGAGVAEDGRLWLLREAPNGRDLRRRLAESGPLPVRELLQLADYLARALASAHAAGLAHGDLRPDWIVEPDPEAKPAVWKIFELGLAHRVGPTLEGLDQSPPGRGLSRPQPLTAPHMPAGFGPRLVAEYAAPELAAAALNGQGQPGEQATDAFALGALLYEAASGRPQLSGSANPAELLAARAAGRGERAANLEHLPDYLAEAIDALLDPRPERRPADLVAWADGLLERSRRARRRVLRLRLGKAALALLVALTIWSQWPKAKPQAGPPLLAELIFSPARTEVPLPWPEGRPEPPTGAQLQLADEHGQLLSGWIVEPRPEDSLMIKAAYGWPAGVERHDAHLLIDGKPMDGLELQIVFLGSQTWELLRPELQNSLGDFVSGTALRPEQLASTTIRPVLRGELGWLEAVRVETLDGNSLVLSPSQLERGVPLSTVFESLGLSAGGPVDFQIAARDRGGVERVKPVALNFARPTRDPSGEPAPGVQPDGANPAVDSEHRSLSDPTGKDGPQAPVSGDSSGTPRFTAQDPVVPSTEVPVETPTQPQEVTPLVTPTPWELKVDGISDGQIIGPSSLPSLEISLDLKGPEEAPLARILLRQEDGAAGPLERTIEPTAWQQTPAGDWRGTVSLAAPWRGAAGGTPWPDGRGILRVVVERSEPGSAPEAMVLRRFQVAVAGPELGFEPPADGLVPPGQNGLWLIEVAAQDPNGVAEVGGRLLLATGQVRQLAVRPGGPSRYQAAAHLEPEDSLQLCQLELFARDEQGNESRSTFDSLHIGLVPGFEPKSVEEVPQRTPDGKSFSAATRPTPAMKRVEGNTTSYLFGGRSDTQENELFREAGLGPFQPDERLGLPRAWAIEIEAGRIPTFLLDAREVSSEEFLAFVRDPEGWPARAWWPIGSIPETGRRTALDELLSQQAGSLPAIGMTWEEASAYASWAGKRLPTWVEFEYALRGGSAYRPFASYEEARATPPNQLPDQTHAGFGSAPSGPRSTDQGDDLTPDTGILGLSGNVAEWTATPVWFDIPAAQRPISPRLAVLEHIGEFLDPIWGIRHPEARDFWVAGGHFQATYFDFTAATPQTRDRGDPTVGMRCALSMDTYLRRLAARLQSLSVPPEKE